jgi:hypothetical protein
MALHLIKLCVGCENIVDLAGSVDRAMARRRAAGQPEFYTHTTRMVPKRIEEIVDGGSLYWVIRGKVQCRQEIAAIEPFVDAEGISRCRLLLRPVIVPTFHQERRPFQGWRYLKSEDAPRDLENDGGSPGALPTELRLELAQLGLL